ncbi:tRNA (cytosine(38)-C(5))-methyltransferase [Halyomorpha halys]|uniref:tRNA (cytosine(38)-C(5))-methyltransferase n=1 Tax=Halyomorpha halys TaxID=286706 RepID=UPI0006D4ECFF|nr:tRNA (cytosine(38)-C(5))-methyltransferase [Halyomorpha halys]
MNSLKVLELYSGIGGMHFALKESKIPGEIIVAADINTVANSVYRYNFPSCHLIGKNIQSLTANFIDKLEIDVILMSPPCQPFTRVGKKRDINDKRSDSLLSLIKILPQLKSLKMILLENVTGFEVSEARNLLIEELKNSFTFLEFILNPSQFGIPNSRERYYLLAKCCSSGFVEQPDKTLITDAKFLINYETKQQIIKDILEFSDDSDEYSKYLVPLDVLKKRIKVMDIVTKTSNRSCCFTKAYSRFTEGTGSVYCPHDESAIEQISEIKNICETEVNLKLLEGLRLRFFTPKEVSRLMCFPENFEFPKEITLRQKYKLLGNSINVFVVSKLISFMTKTA